MASTEIAIKISARGESAEQAIARISGQLKSLEGKAEQASSSLSSRLSNVFKSPIQSVKSFIAACGPLGAAVASGFAVEKVMQFASAVSKTSDAMALMRSRIDLINDGHQSTQELLDKIHASANSARSSYQDTVNVVGKLGILAKEAFSSNDEMIFFAQQMNKQFQIGGSSIQEQTAAMYQLTQAMAAGRLQGDEFRSIMENAPLLAQAISREMGVSMGTLRELSSQGLITADIIKAAMVNSAEETNAKFAQLPMTFESIATLLGNNFLQAFEPVWAELGNMANSSFVQEALPVISQGFSVLGQTVLVAMDALSAAFAIVTTAVATMWDISAALGSVFMGLAAAIPPLLPLLLGVATYALLVGTNFGIATTRVAQSMVTQTAAIAKGAIQFTLYAAGVLLVAAAQGTLIVAQTLLSAATYKTIAAVALETAAWVANAARKGAVLAVTSAIRVAQLAYNAVQVIGLALLGAYNAALMMNAARLVVVRGAQLAASAATAVFSGTMAVLNAIIAMNPIPLLIGVLVAVAAAFFGSEVAANGFGATLESVFSSIVHTAVWAVNKIIGLLNGLISALNSVGSKLGKVLKFDYNAIDQIQKIDPQVAEDIKTRAVEFGNSLTAAPDMGSIDIPSAGGGDYSIPEKAGKGGSGRGAGKNAGDQLLEQAKQIHDSIEQEWLQLFGTKDQLVDKWYKEELDKLNESKAANMQYTEDLKKLNEVYADKRMKALREEAQAIRDVQNKARDLSDSIYSNTSLKNLDGSAKLFADIEQERKHAIDKMLDDMQAAENEFADMNERSKAAYIARLKEEGVAFAVTSDGMLSLAQARADQEVAINEEAQRKIADIRRQGKDIQADIDVAFEQGRADILRGYLESADYETMMSYERQKEYMNQYVDAFRNAHTTMQDILIGTTKSAIDSLSDSISGLLKGTMSIATAFQNLGKAVSKSISDMVADMIAARMKQWLFGKAMMAQEAAVSTAMATAQMGPISQLALEMSMASWGASAMAGRAAYTAAGGQAGGFGGAGLGGLGGGESYMLNNSVGSQLAKSSGIALPKLQMASGGYAYGDTVAMIGEGKYPEAVLPLSDEVFDQMGEGINRAGGGGNITLNISTMDATSFAGWLTSKGGQVLRQYLMDTGREFASNTGVW